MSKVTKDQYIKDLEHDMDMLSTMVLDLRKENKQLKMRLNCGAPTDGLEVGSPEDYGEAPLIYESPDGGKTIYQRRAGNYDNRKELSDE
tara:strand:+ start:526 stop:792 length:267 start_codon:yes stop_codon:yes gene_type:complete